MEKIPFPTFEEWLKLQPADKQGDLLAAKNSYFTQWGIAVHKAKGYWWA
jgi:hypothetical protein